MQVLSIYSLRPSLYKPDLLPENLYSSEIAVPKAHIRISLSHHLNESAL